MIITIGSYTIKIGINTLITIVSTLLTFLSTFFAYRQYSHFIKEKTNQRILNKYFGSDLFGEETIKNSTYCYVEPNCTDVDPSREAEPKNLCMIEGNMFSVLDKYLLKEIPKKNAIHHILILADSGMGKTSFLLNYYAYNLKKKKKKRQRIALIPLGIPNVDEYIDSIKSKKNTIIFLDAFDEDTKAIKNHRQRLSHLLKKCSPFKRVIITCRTQFFPSDEEIPKETGIIKIGPRKAGEKRVYSFNKLYLSPLNDIQVDLFLKKRFKWNLKRRKIAKLLIQKIPNLKVRPMLLANIPDLIESGYTDVKYAFQLYEIMVDNWLERERKWINDKENLRTFSEKLAFDIYLDRERRGSEKIPINELTTLAKKWNIELKDWQLTTRSLLNRDAIGNYKFAHRSIMEFLFIIHFFKLENKLRPTVKWTDQQLKFILEHLKINKNSTIEGVNFKLSINLPEWIEKGLDKKGCYSKEQIVNCIKKGYKNIRVADLNDADLRDVDFTNINFKEINIRRAYAEGANFKNSMNLPEWIVKGLDKKGIFEKKRLIDNIRKGFRNLRGADLRRAYLSGLDFRETNLNGVDLKKAYLKGIDFEGANFKDSINLPEWIEKGLNTEGTYSTKKLINSIIDDGFRNLKSANLIKADLSEVTFRGCNLQKINLKKANLENADLTDTNLSGADLFGVNLEKANLKNSKGIPIWIEKGLNNDSIFSKKQLIDKIKKGFSSLEGAYLEKPRSIFPEWINKGLDNDGTYSEEQLIINIKKGFKTLQGVKLAYADLREIDFKEADLREAHLYRADLRNADLSDADLKKANLGSSDLRHTKLKGANFEGAELDHANLRDVKFIKACLKNTLFRSADFRGSEMIRCDLEGAIFNYSKNFPTWIRIGLNKDGVYSRSLFIKNLKTENVYYHKNLIGADLCNLDLREADFSGANLSGADLRGTSLERAELEKAKFENTKGLPKWVENGLNKDGIYSKKQLILNIRKGFKDLKGANLKNGDLRGTDLRGINFKGVILEGVNIDKAMFKNSKNIPKWIEHGLTNDGIYLQNQLIENIMKGFKTLQGANLTGACLNGFDLIGADFTDVDFSGAKLNKVKIENANFKNSKGIPEWIKKGLNDEFVYFQRQLISNIKEGFRNLEGAYLLGVELKGEDLKSANFCNAILCKADLKEADLRGSNFQDALLMETKLERAYVERVNFTNAIGLPDWIDKGLDNNGIYSSIELINNIKRGFKNLEGANLFKVRIRDLRKANLRYTNLKESDLTYSNLSETDFEGAIIDRIQIEKANFKNSINLQEWVINGLSEEGTYLQMHLINNIRKGFKNLVGSNLSKADLIKADLRKADLRGATLSGANLRGANLRGADLRGVDLRGTDLRGVDLRGTDLSGVDLSDAHTDGVNQIYEG